MENRNVDTEQWIKLMDYQRHEWMNDLQVLFGYVRLKKYDKLIEVVEKLKDKASRESVITKLGMPELSKQLLLFQLSNQSMGLQVGTDGYGLTESQLNPDMLVQLVMQSVHAFASAAADASLLTLRFEKLLDASSGLRFCYTGDYDLATLDVRISEAAGLWKKEGASVSIDYGNSMVTVYITFS